MPFRGRQTRPQPRGGRGPERGSTTEIVSYEFFSSGTRICHGDNIECVLEEPLKGRRDRGNKYNWPKFIAENDAGYTKMGIPGTIFKGEEFSADSPE